MRSLSALTVAASISAAVTSISCGGDAVTQIVVVVTADRFAIPADVDEVRVVAGTRRSSGMLTDAGSLPATVTLVPSGDGEATVEVTVALRRDGEAVVEQSATAQFVPGESRALVFRLTPRCAGSACACPEPGRVEWPGSLDRLEVDVPPASELEVLDIEAGNEHTCAIERCAGRVYCWGANGAGQLGGAAPASGSARPVPVPGTFRSRMIAAGRHHTCAVVGEEGAIHCWGDNGSGQLGAGSTDGSGRVVLEAVSDPVFLSAGGEHTCAVVAGGGVWCWGAGDSGQLGRTDRDPEPGPVPGLEARTTGGSVSAGERHTCAVTATGAVTCFGDNAAGQVGVDPAERSQVLSPSDVTGLSDAVAVTAGNRHTCALRSDGAVLCWGSSSNAELGIGSAPSDPGYFFEPQLAALDPPDAEAVAVGRQHSCARRGSSVDCWGRNDVGQVGVESMTELVLSPSRVDLGGAVSSVTTGGFHTCVIADFTAVCWGFNSEGQLGRSTADETRREPRPIAPP